MNVGDSLVLIKNKRLILKLLSTPELCRHHYDTITTLPMTKETKKKSTLQCHFHLNQQKLIVSKCQQNEKKLKGIR